MKYPEVLLLPVLMLADYYLTLWGAIEREKNYGLHFKVENYELNPLWQKDVRKKNWFNLRFLVLVIMLPLVLGYCWETGNSSKSTVEFLFGCLLAVYGAIIGRHLHNLFLFKFVRRNPDEVSGEINISNRFVLYNSIFQLLLVIVPILFIAIYDGNSVAWGGVLGIIILVIVQLFWLRKANKRRT